ncbi:subunit 17 of mediator complex-domain-containing protein [Bombardia bombarda]|uniref:Mediator of RNA polymerase II transcription subunit 17 n=1 Tax=Bombardia bombarda TaxID=252184 RepID=A0AA39TQA1_9PEZI|nr:subunit 17 of mediator complex-domain-containing protein [Bombardia bombarda]
MDLPLSLQPRGPRNRGLQSIAEFIQRINAEPGGFRELNEDDLRQSLATAEPDDQGADDDVDMLEEGSEPEEAALKEVNLLAARDELQQNILTAQGTALLTLDFISLLLSKEIPSQNAATISTELHNMVGAGVLGATVLWAPTPLTRSRVPEDKMMAIGKRLIEINKAADTALSAAERLRKEIILETKYWAEVLAVSEKGWSAFRLPQEPHTMGVKYGFSNAAPDFRAHSVAPMRRAEDGTVRLECGRLGGDSKRLRVTITRNATVVGQSSLPLPLPEDAPLEDRVREARDTIFAQELWHELNREGRNLLSNNVRLEKSAVTYAADSATTIAFQLVPSDRGDSRSVQNPGSEDDIAETINLGSPPPYSLLLPVITYYQHEKTIQRCMDFLSVLSRVLRSAGLDTSLVITEPPITPPAGFDLAITPDSRLRIIAKPSSLFGTRFLVYPLPSARAPDAPNPLIRWFPSASPEIRTPGGFADGFYDGTKKLFWYLLNAVPRALTLHYAPITKELRSGAGMTDREPTNWVIHFTGKALVDDDVELLGVRFDFPLDYATGYPELHVAGDFSEGGKPVHMEWSWTPASSLEGGGENLENIVRQVLSRG